tara:strand:- start:6843 stop:7046 length:204 start_codon:yes stop_codon:yes gene_type:complete
MANPKNIVLPIPRQEYDAMEETVSRRITEQAIQDLAIQISKLSRLQDVVSSKAVKRQQFLLMGMKHG